MLLVVDLLSGRVFTEAIAKLVLAPLKVEEYLVVEPPRHPTANGREPDKYTGTPLEPFNSPFWRSLARPWEAW